MFTHYYKGMFIHGYFDRKECHVTAENDHFRGRRFPTYRAAQMAITKARNAGVPASRGA